MRYKLGKNLHKGDTIRVWWMNTLTDRTEDTITKLYKYKGPLEYLWPAGARIATFSFNQMGMTIDNTSYYEVME